ncbi:hypothetical protein JTE90_001578 [Oedothorax gibbosus]|uniref:Uncharacterized protein n=1 Tax=Oedothorax gibbosus TaxID=931172 RepID=A0AAV6VP45_9ARAC|nr:hypothetical protein JTE90_001578 [Oedothorax gibbosus]
MYLLPPLTPLHSSSHKYFPNKPHRTQKKLPVNIAMSEQFRREMYLLRSLTPPHSSPHKYFSNYNQTSLSTKPPAGEQQKFQKPREENKSIEYVQDSKH